jgi:hypothetical protein
MWGKRKSMAAAKREVRPFAEKECLVWSRTGILRGYDDWDGSGEEQKTPRWKRRKARD